MARLTTKIGDVFCVKINDESKKYFQYIANHITQLNSDVIRCFMKRYPVESTPDVTEIINDDIDFYAHCVTKLGIKMSRWHLIGNSNILGDYQKVLFNLSEDYGNPNVVISRNWWVWQVNQELKYVGGLVGVNRLAEIGIIINPDSIVYRMENGKFDFVYPGFQ